MTQIKTIYSDKKQPTKMVIWDLGRRCNFDCSYCTAWMHSTTAPFNPVEKYKKTAEFIDRYYSLYSMYHKENWRVMISFTGGEPAVNPAFFELLPWLKKKYPYMVLSLTTNGTWNERKGKMLMEHLDSFTVSYHCEGNDKQKELIRRNLLWLRQNLPNKHKLKVNVMMHMDHWDECVDLIENFLKPNDIKYIPRVIGDDDLDRAEWREDDDGVMRRTSHIYTEEQQWYLKNHWRDQNASVGEAAKPKNAKDGLARKMGRMCCGGRCMTVTTEDNKTQDQMFIDQTNFKGWNCMVNWFFLHIEEDKDAVYHHQTCRAILKGAPRYNFPTLAHKKGIITDTNGPICRLSETDSYLEWLEGEFEKGRTPTMICPNSYCGCGICVPKSKDDEDFKKLKSDYIYSRE